MGEAKRRGTFEERKAMAVAKAKAEERERLWNEKQRQRREERLKSEAIRPKESPKRMNTRLLVAAAMAMASAGMVTGK